MTHTHTQSPHRFDHVGSFLRPENLLQARDEFAEGNISKEELTAIEDQAIIELIKKQEEAGLKAVTDGEFRRASWHCDFFWGFDGVQEIQNESRGSKFEGTTYGITARLEGKIKFTNHPFIDHYLFAREHASDDVEVKLTIPAPAQFLQELRREINIDATNEHYDTIEELADDIVQAYGDFLNALYEVGARTVQFDDCTWSRIISGSDHTGREYEQSELDELKDLYVTINNRAIAAKPEGLRINTHVCRGNFRSSWFASGAYTSVASPLFDQENVNAYYLEYDSDRAGGFEPLEKVSEGKKVVLGLVTSKYGELESKDELVARIKEASKYVPLEDLYISPQCGFSSNAVGNEITDEDQWNKIALIKEVAEEVWGEA